MDAALIAKVLVLRALFRRRERWSRQRLERHQTAALRELRDHAWRHSPFYRRFHRGLTDRPLEELPVLTKAMLMEHFDELVTDRAVRLAEAEAHATGPRGDERFLGRYEVSLTSGTTGRRGVFLAGPAEWATILASYIRANDWAGLKAGPLHPLRLTVVSSTASWHQSARFGASLRSPFVQVTRFDATRPLSEIVSGLEAARPRSLVAYASMARVLAEEQLAGRLHIAPRAVMCASEVLTDEARQRIEQAWGVKPFNVYAATETAGLASECERHSGLHLYEDLVITEVVDEDNRPVPPGTYGARVLVTVLFSRTQPLIRYEMSDSVCLSVEPCGCGRPFALLAGIQGREEDVLHLADGRGGTVAIPPNVFHRVLEPLPVRAWQVRHEPDGLVVLVTGPGAGFDASSLVERLQRALMEQGARAPAVRVERVSSIARTGVGKARLIQALREPSRPAG